MTFGNLRYPLFAISVLTLLVAIWAGLLRLGWPWSAFLGRLSFSHGALMISGFLGTLIGIERAVALRNFWPYLAPISSGLGGLMLIIGAPDLVGRGLISLGSLVMTIVFFYALRKHFALHTLLLSLGALSWLIGNLLWLSGWQVYRIVLWWAGFLILTIAGERLELARLLRLSQVRRLAFIISIVIFLTGLLLSIFVYDPGTRMAGTGIFLLALWLIISDIIRKTLRHSGLPQYIAITLLIGYLWLGLAGALGLIYGGTAAGPLYDAFLHAIFLGFVFSMIFGHAPMIFPVIFGRQAVYHRALFAPMVLLTLSLIMRLAGDIRGVIPWRMCGGLLNGVALILFIVSMGVLVLKGAGYGNEARPLSD